MGQVKNIKWRRSRGIKIKETTIRETPVRALQLAEDIERIRLALVILRDVDPLNITATDTELQRDFAFDMRRLTLALIESWKRVAEKKMRREYLVL